MDAAGLQLLESMGFDRALAAEALKQVLNHILPGLADSAVHYSLIEAIQ